MSFSKYFQIEDERMEKTFNGYKYTLKALRNSADRRTRMRVIYGDQVIQVD